MIIVEGMDNSGKTKLTEHLAERFKLPHIKSPKDRTHLLNDALTTLMLNPEAVLDRFSAISEAIYGPILRGGTAFDKYVSQWKFFMDKLVRCKPLIFYCRPPEKQIFAYGDRKQMAGVVEHKEELLSAYDTMMSSWAGRLLIMKYDFTLPNARSFADYAVEVYLAKKRMDRYEHTGC